MSADHAGITIIVDQGPKRTIINVPKAENVESVLLGAPVDVWERFNIDPRRLWALPIIPPTTAFLFRPVGQYTIREETNPMHTPAPPLSEQEQAEVDRFGIHDEDRGVW